MINKERFSQGFKNWGKNAKTLVATEPFWSLPMSWVFFYRPIFLRESIGLSEIQIGLLSTVFTLFSIIGPLAGGYLADRFGRKRIFMFFDSIFWISSLTIWVITENILYALIAYMLQGMTTVVFSIWECLLVEDTRKEFRAGIYGFVSASYNFGALSTPVAGYLIGKHGVDFGCRLLFMIALLSMIPMFVIRQALLKETDIGYSIMKEKSFTGIKGYLSSFSLIKSSNMLTALLLLSIIGNFYYAVTSYLPLYLVDLGGLDLTEDLASLVPAATSISALFMVLFIVPNLRKRDHYIKVLATGYFLGCFSMILLTNSPKACLSLAITSGILLGIHQATSFSVSRTLLTNEIESVDNKARAKILSLTLTLSSLLNLPSSTIAGYLFSLQPRFPFIVLSTTLILSLVTLLVTYKFTKK